MIYYLMHENHKVAEITIGKFENIIRIVLNKVEINHLPIGVSSETDLANWITNRCIPTTRQGIYKEIRACNIRSPFQLMLLNNGVSLSDHYWLKEEGSNLDWNDINLYDNDFTAKYSLDIRDEIRNNKNVFSPSTSLGGDLKKKWIIDNKGIRRLVKGNLGISCRQSLCEVLAAEIHKRQGIFSYTPYSIIKIQSDNQGVLGCECPNFTTNMTEFVPAIDIVSTNKKSNNISYYEFFIKCCEEHNLNIRMFLEYQIMTDFIITNVDRHFNNFGIIRNAKTLEWISNAPIFDSGNSMFYKTNYVPIDRCLLNIEVNSFLSKEVNMLKYITNRGIVNLNLLPKDEELYHLLRHDSIIKEEINERLVKAYNRKIKYLSDFQNGADIWKYGYKR